MPYAQPQHVFGKTRVLKWLMMRSLVLVQTFCSLYIKIYPLIWCHTSCVYFTMTCRDSVQCGIVTALKGYWRSNNLHQIFLYTNVHVYFRHFSTETLTFKKMIFLILCWMTERYFDESWHSLEVYVFQGRARWVIYTYRIVFTWMTNLTIIT